MACFSCCAFLSSAAFAVSLRWRCARAGDAAAAGTAPASDALRRASAPAAAPAGSRASALTSAGLSAGALAAAATTAAAHRSARRAPILYPSRNTSALVSMEARKGGSENPTVLHASDKADIGGVFSDPVTKEPQAVSTNYLRNTWTVLDPDLKADFDAIAAQV